MILEFDESDDSTYQVQSTPIEFVGDINPEIDIHHGSNILIISKDQSYLTHGIHKFPAKFFPELPRYLIKRFSERGETILDPMCGSGTVVLEGLLNDRRAVGIDIDPIAQLVTRVKTKPLDEQVLRRLSNDTQHNIVQRFENGYTPTHIPEFNYRDNWFHDFVLHELGIIKDTISDVSRSHPDYLDFFTVIFSSIIRDVSNADPHCTRTVIRNKQTRNITPGETLSKYAKVLDQQVHAMVDLIKTAGDFIHWNIQILGCSATSTGLDSDSIHLAVTSPPYINAVDYPRTHQLEMYWLDLVEDGPLSKMKRKYIGTETVYKNEYQELKVSEYEQLDSVLERIYESDPRRSFITFKFFEDMKEQLRETYRVLRPGGHYCMAIGNNVIRGVRVKSHEILSEIAMSDDVGFELDRVFFSGLIRHFIKIPRKERMGGEWVIILRKPE
ncbi:MAG: DNA methyltransferase [Candidatus Thorarchaeota archaeon]